MVRTATRQMLHASELHLTHPLTGREMAFTAPLPADMARLLAGLRERPNAAEAGPRRRKCSPGTKCGIGAGWPMLWDTNPRPPERPAPGPPKQRTTTDGGPGYQKSEHP